MYIRINNLSKEYPRKDGTVKALDGFSLDVEKGDFVTITGRSGSGKTTLLLALGGLLKPSSGELLFNNMSIDLQNEKSMENFRSDHVSYVMQNFALIPYLTALENILIAMNIKAGKPADNEKRAEELLRWVGLGDRMSHLPKELSAGQQQRVAIARALANNPGLLLADEPTGNLDPGLSAEILDLLKEINRKGMTIIMVTHSEAASLYGNVRLRLEKGRIAEHSIVNRSK